ncbi:tryptophan 7-halogenase [Myxococcota bacterium]|nr:tryptophan 7-halogenase [Myxococcota bacterium]
MQTIPENIDVAIIGAGPAGTMAAALLKKAGFSVAIIERDYHPRFVIGESLLPRCNHLLADAGLLADVAKRDYIVKHGAVFKFGNLQTRFDFSDGLPGEWKTTFQVPRDDFDLTLAQSVSRKGVKIFYGYEVRSFAETDDGAELGIVDTEGESGSVIKAKFVVDASGYGRVLPRLLGLEGKPELPDRVSLFAQFEGDIHPEGNEAGDIWITLTASGAWIWMIPFGNGRTSVGVVASSEIINAAGKTHKEQLHAILNSEPDVQKRLQDARQVQPARRIEGWSKAVTRFSGKHWVLVGNASEFLDPVFSSGISLAFESATLAARLIERTLHNEKVDWDEEYTATMERAIQVFRVFINAWYKGDLQRIFFADKDAPGIKQSITSVLAGYVLDTKNTKNSILRNPEGALSALLKSLDH